MILYHGSNVGGIQELEPKVADHECPYVYMTTIEVVSAFYLCNAVEKPYYWFPYGFVKDKNIPIYHELYPNALKEVSKGVHGYIYEIETSEELVLPFKNIPHARLGTKPMKVKNCIEVKDAYELFMNYIEQGKMQIGSFEEKTKEELEWWNLAIVNYLKEKEMMKKADSSYAMFIKDKLPHIWERYINEVIKTETTYDLT